MALQRGDTGPLVLAAQVLLRVPRTGTFDAITELAVVQLQQKFGLPVNGILDTAEYTAARHASSHETAGADPINPAAITGAPWLLKAGDTMTGALSVTAPTGTALTVNSTNGVGELALKIRTAAATSAAAQAGVDYGFNNYYRITQAVAGAGIGAPFGSAAYTYCAGVPYRFITDNVLNGIEFWAGSIYAARVYYGTVQCGAVPSGGSTTGIPLYCGKNAATVQLRVGDLSGNCWSIGRDNVNSGDLIIEPTAPAGTTPFASALRVSGATGVCRATFGQQIGASGTTITQTKVYTPTLAPANVSASDEYNEQYFTVTGLSTSDTVIVNPPAMGSLHSQMICARVSAANTLALTFRAVSGTHPPPQGVYRVLAIRS